MFTLFKKQPATSNKDTATEPRQQAPGTLSLISELIPFCKRGAIMVYDCNLFGNTLEERRKSIDLLRQYEVRVVLEPEQRTLAPEDFWELEIRDLAQDEATA